MLLRASVYIFDLGEVKEGEGWLGSRGTITNEARCEFSSIGEICLYQSHNTTTAPQPQVHLHDRHVEAGPTFTRAPRLV